MPIPVAFSSPRSPEIARYRLPKYVESSALCSARALASGIVLGRAGADHPAKIALVAQWNCRESIACSSFQAFAQRMHGPRHAIGRPCSASQLQHMAVTSILSPNYHELLPRLGTFTPPPSWH